MAKVELIVVSLRMLIRQNNTMLSGKAENKDTERNKTMYRYILVMMLIIVLGGCAVNEQIDEPMESELIVETGEDVNVADKA